MDVQDDWKFDTKINRLPHIDEFLLLKRANMLQLTEQRFLLCINSAVINFSANEQPHSSLLSPLRSTQSLRMSMYANNKFSCKRLDGKLNSSKFSSVHDRAFHISSLLMHQLCSRPFLRCPGFFIDRMLRPGHKARYFFMHQHSTMTPTLKLHC